MSGASDLQTQAPNPFQRANEGPLYMAVAESLQRKITAGEYPPGSALPAVSEIAEGYRVANMTARQAVGLLVKKGFVTRRHGKGTFVLEGAGRLLIGILVGPSITDEATYFYRAMVSALREATEARGWISRTYDALTENGLPRPMTASAVKQLRMDLHSQVFHGFVELSPGVKGLSEMEAGFPLPKVKCDSTAPQNDIEFSFYDFGRKSVEFLVGRGISDLVYLRPQFQTGLEEVSAISRDIDGMFDAVKSLQIPQPEIDSIVLPAAPGMSRQSDETLYEHAIRLFRARKKQKRKFGLIVNDDIGMRTVALAIAHEQVKVPDDCEIICLAHENIYHYYGVPIHRYDQPSQEFARRSLDVLQARIFDEPVPALPIVITGTIAPMGSTLSTRPAKAEAPAQV